MRLSSSISCSLLVLALAAGCNTSSPTEISYEPETQGIRAGYITVTPTADGLVVVNQTERPVYLIAIERETSTRVDWIPCTGGAGCPALTQGDSRTVPWSSVLGYSADRPSYVVSWWHVVTAADGTVRAGAILHVNVSR